MRRRKDTPSRGIRDEVPLRRKADMAQQPLGDAARGDPISGIQSRVGRERIYGRGEGRTARGEGRTPHLRRDRLREHRRGPLQRSAVSDEAHPERNRKRRETNSGEIENVAGSPPHRGGDSIKI